MIPVILKGIVRRVIRKQVGEVIGRALEPERSAQRPAGKRSVSSTAQEKSVVQKELENMETVSRIGSYFIPTSLTWLAGFAMIVMGIADLAGFLNTEMGGEILITNGLAMIGLRAKQERQK